MTVAIGHEAEMGTASEGEEVLRMWGGVIQHGQHEGGGQLLLVGGYQGHGEIVEDVQQKVCMKKPNETHYFIY